MAQPIRITLIVATLALFAFQSVALGWSIPGQYEFAELARLKSEFAAFHNLQLTSKGEVLLVQGDGGTEAWDVLTKKRLWRREINLSVQRFSADESEFLWLDQQSRPAEIVQTDLRTGEDRRRTPLKSEAVKFAHADFGMGRAPILAAQYKAEDGARLSTYSVESGETLTDVKLPLGSGGEPIEIEALGVARDGKRFLLAMKEAVLICDERCKVERRIALKYPVRRLRCLSDGKRAIATEVATGSPLLLDLNVGRTDNVAGQVSAFDISPQGVVVVSYRRQSDPPKPRSELSPRRPMPGELSAFGLSDRISFAVHDPEFDRTVSLAISADGEHVVAADANGALVVYKLQPDRSFR